MSNLNVKNAKLFFSYLINFFQYYNAQIRCLVYFITHFVGNKRILCAYF